MSLLTDYIEIAAEEAAAALFVANGDHLGNGDEFAQTRYPSEIFELAETLNRAAAICQKPGVAQVLAGVHSRRLAACVQTFSAAAKSQPEPEPEPEPEPAATDSLSPGEQAILRHLRKTGSATMQEIGEAAGYSYNYLRSICPQMVAKGLLRRDSNRPVRYEATQ